MSQKDVEAGREELGRLKARIARYEKQMGKMDSPYPSLKRHDHTSFYDGQHLKIALLSDTHIGSIHERLHALDQAYKIMEQEGVQHAYHSGDLVAGEHVYKGQAYELKSHGVNEQVNRFVKQYPRSSSVKTHFITGNHDLAFLKTAGCDIGEMIAQKRPDMTYVGQMEGDVLIAPRVSLKLKHGMGGGGSYAKSYKMQRFIDSLEPNNRPAILANGHYHHDFYMTHSDVHAFNVGCFEGASLFLKTLGLQPSISFWMLDMHIRAGRVNRMRPELFKFT